MRLVLGLDFLNVVEIGGVEELGAADDVNKLGLRPENLGDAGRNGALPSRASDEKRAAVVAACPCADVVEIECVEIHHLEDPIAVFLHRWDGEDDGLRAEVETQEGVWSVGIGSDESGIGGREDACKAERSVEWSFVLGIVLVDREGIHGEVTLHHGVAVDVRVFSDSSGFRW